MNARHKYTDFERLVSDDLDNIYVNKFFDYIIIDKPDGQNINIIDNYFDEDISVDDKKEIDVKIEEKEKEHNKDILNGSIFNSMYEPALEPLFNSLFEPFIKSISSPEIHNKNESITLSDQNTNTNINTNINTNVETNEITILANHHENTNDDQTNNFFKCYNEDSVNNAVVTIENTNDEFIFDKDPDLAKSVNEINRFNNNDINPYNFYSTKYQKQKNMNGLSMVALSAMVVMGSAWLNKYT